ncbi:ATP-binding protein [Rhizobium leguminosarum bv. viciae]|uniref:AAA family ATPase n=1 Tax=Rhizobium leguminosarum TaxID=384 RepID=UPI00103C0A2A|nr:AAA family ATPase [Rhizobium leguminosarum]MBY5530206.1 AAA family ATPase [Rhizobium leguminosarum]TBY30677.1 ATP-binding protein [Rhizobium leguminosarum bv. viciae]TBY35713.1 ATP-binding protein [Rhizobium leguminosarum bv. viciae]TCA94803.1 ATP-binding protein [Rhizobium leguminosarum bv. viciae]
MLIRSVHFSQHPVLGELKLDFCDDTGVPFETIIFAGGNGTGKTAILNAVHQVFTWNSAKNIGKVELEIELDITNRSALEAIVPNGRAQSVDNNILRITYDGTHPTISAQNDHRLSWTSNGKEVTVDRGALGDQQKRAQFLRSFFNEAQVNFTPARITATTTKQLDDPTSSAVASGGEVSEAISQLLVDVRAHDAEDLLKWTKENPGKVVPAALIEPRISRFTEAFDFMFPEKRFVGVNRNGRNLEVQFTEFGRTSTIDQLSTGEKQIVFRGGFVLSNLERVRSGLLLIDEPELSLNPTWQERILGFYRRLLPTTESSHCQLIVATHSPFVVHDAPGAKVIVLERGDDGKVQIMTNPSFPTAGRSEVIRAFNIDRFLRAAEHELLVFVEGETDRQLIELAWRKLFSEKSSYFELRPALGAKNINITLNDQMVFSKVGSRKLVGLFDFDDAYNHWNGVWRKDGADTGSEIDGIIRSHPTERGWAMLLPVPAHRSGFASRLLKGNSIMSIEFLFDDSELPQAYVTNRPAPLGAALPTFNDKFKPAFVAHAETLPASSFEPFRPLFDRLNEIKRK